jgi:hypothetical protein
MKKIAAITFALAVIWACSPKTSPALESGEPRTLSADAVAGQELFTGKCGRCHDLPVVEEYSAKRWKKIVPPMAKKAKLDATQESQVMAYVLETVGE